MTALHCMMRLIEARGKASIRMMWQFHSPNQKTESKPAHPSLAIQKSLWLPVNQQSRYLEVFFSLAECFTDFGTFSKAALLTCLDFTYLNLSSQTTTQVLRGEERTV